MRDPHVADSRWSRLWHLTLSGSDRRRIMEAVLAGRVMEDRGEALLAAELARQLLTEKRRRPPLWLIRTFVAVAFLLVAMAVLLDDGVSWDGFLLPAVFGLQAVILLILRRSTPDMHRLEQAERLNLARSRQGDV